MKTNQNRRNFIQKSLVGIGTLLGTEVVFAKNIPVGVKILGEKAFKDDLPEGKHKEMMILNDKPLNIETPAHLLDDVVTPAEKMFVRNNGNLPENSNPQKWSLEISGESVKAKKIFTLADLKSKFKTYTYQLQMECGGNGRAGFSPQTAGNQWQEGAISCAEWTGVRLKDVLEAVGLKPDAVYVAYTGTDVHLSGDPEKATISRGVPLKKALEDETLIAWAMNGKDIPFLHGYPLRLVIGGWPASVSGKWLNKILVRNKVHDGEKMSGHSYKVPKYPIEPGGKVNDADLEIIESMPVKSLITYPKSGAIISNSNSLSIRGHSWAGDNEVKEMHVSIDYGTTWLRCSLNKPKNRLSWQQWSADLKFPRKGYYEIWAKATDSNNKSQPMVIPAWNPGGYLNNSCHRIALKVE
jgi:DMSO/TMAO reductase YedYZ molybdopterin-dependent catalytic subunit